MAERAARRILAAKAAQGDPARLVQALEAAFAEELSVEERLREEADKVIEANRALARGSGADLHVLREKIMAKLAHDRGRVLR